MQQKTTFIILLVLSVTIGFVHCQSEDDEKDGIWSKLKKMVKEFVSSMRELWGEMTKEIKERTADMSSWTKEMFDSFKEKMKEWVDQVAGASKSEREDMRNYIERLEMTPPNEEQRK